MAATWHINREYEGIEISFDGKPSEEIRNKMKAVGFRWSSAQMKWYAKDNDRTRKVASELAIQGEDVGEYLTFEQKMERDKERAERRQERLGAKAEKLEQKSEALLDQAHKMADVIPFGQPILVGHHSEGRDRRYRGRIHDKFGKAFETQDEAKDVKLRLEGSEALSRKRETPGYMSRKIDQLEAELRKFEREKKYWETNLPEWEKRTNNLKEQIAYWKKELGEAGGLKVTPDDVKAGDEIRYMGTWYEVVRVNPKTVTIKNWLGVPTMTWGAEYSKIKEVRHKEPKEEVEGPEELKEVPARESTIVKNQVEALGVKVLRAKIEADKQPKTSGTQEIHKRAKAVAEWWFNSQMKNPFTEFYLYHKIGDFRVATETPEGYKLSDAQRISPAWTKEQAEQWIYDKVQKLPILPLSPVIELPLYMPRIEKENLVKRIEYKGWAVEYKFEWQSAMGYYSGFIWVNRGLGEGIRTAVIQIKSADEIPAEIDKAIADAEKVTQKPEVAKGYKYLSPSDVKTTKELVKIEKDMPYYKTGVPALYPAKEASQEQRLWDDLKDMKVVDFDVIHDINPDKPTRNYYHVYDRTIAILENGKRVQISYVINKGEHGKRAAKAKKEYYVKFYDQYMGKPLSEWIDFAQFERGNSYESFMKNQKEKPKFTFEPVFGAPLGKTVVPYPEFGKSVQTPDKPKVNLMRRLKEATTVIELQVLQREIKESSYPEAEKYELLSIAEGRLSAMGVEFKPKVIGAPTKQEQALREAREKSYEGMRLKGQQTLVSAVSTSKRLSAFEEKEKSMASEEKKKKLQEEKEKLEAKLAEEDKLRRELAEMQKMLGE